MECKKCGERWNQVLRQQQLNRNTMAKDKKTEEVKQVTETNVNTAKPNIEKIIDDRRKAIIDSKQVNK